MSNSTPPAAAEAAPASGSEAPATNVHVTPRSEVDAWLRSFGVLDGLAGLPRKLALQMQLKTMPPELRLLGVVLGNAELEADVVFTLRLPGLPSPLLFTWSMRPDAQLALDVLAKGKAP